MYPAVVVLLVVVESLGLRLHVMACFSSSRPATFSILFCLFACSGASREFRYRHGPTYPFATMDAIEWRFKLKEAWVIDASTGNKFYPPETVRRKKPN